MDETFLKRFYLFMRAREREREREQQGMHQESFRSSDEGQGTVRSLTEGRAQNHRRQGTKNWLKARGGVFTSAA